MKKVSEEFKRIVALHAIAPKSLCRAMANCERELDKIAVVLDLSVDQKAELWQAITEKAVSMPHPSTVLFDRVYQQALLGKSYEFILRELKAG